MFITAANWPGVCNTRSLSLIPRCIPNTSFPFIPRSFSLSHLSPFAWQQSFPGLIKRIAPAFPGFLCRSPPPSPDYIFQPPHTGKKHHFKPARTNILTWKKRLSFRQTTPFRGVVPPPVKVVAAAQSCCCCEASFASFTFVGTLARGSWSLLRLNGW